MMKFAPLEPPPGLADLGAHIATSMGDAVRAKRIAFGELTIDAKAEDILAILKFLRDDKHCLFETLIDICGVDYPEREKRFDLVYHLLSMRKNQRVRVKIETDEATPVSSVVGVFPCADWFEREAFDMYGILFSGHPDLRRILTDYGFVGHAFRKDFPLIGQVEMRYDPEKQRVVYQPVSIEPRVLVPRVIREEGFAKG
jgi:NADH-quinone oxidoreductase subunit C